MSPNLQQVWWRPLNLINLGFLFSFGREGSILIFMFDCGVNKHERHLIMWFYVIKIVLLNLTASVKLILNLSKLTKFDILNMEAWNVLFKFFALTSREILLIYFLLKLLNLISRISFNHWKYQWIQKSAFLNPNSCIKC